MQTCHQKKARPTKSGAALTGIENSPRRESPLQRGVDFFAKHGDSLTKKKRNPDFVFQEPESKEVHTLFKSVDFKIKDDQRSTATTLSSPEKKQREDLLPKTTKRHALPAETRRKRQRSLDKVSFRKELTLKDSCPGKIPDRKSYAGSFRNGRFHPNLKAVDDLDPVVAQQIADDLEQMRLAKDEYFTSRKLQYETDQKIRDKEHAETMALRLDEFNKQREAELEEKMQRQKEWYVRKEAEARGRKRDLQLNIEKLLERDQVQAEALRKIENDRTVERNARLAIAERRKEMLHQQILELRRDPALKRNRDRMPDQQLLKASSEEHQHVHHHIHYHHINEVGEQFSVGARKKIEEESEKNVRQDFFGATPTASADPLSLAAQQLNLSTLSAEGKPTHGEKHFHYHFANSDQATTEFLVENQPDRPSCRPKMSQTVNKLGKESGLTKYSSAVNVAIGTYAHTGRVRYMRDRTYQSFVDTNMSRVTS